MGTNPITTPQPPNGMGLGHIKSSFSLLQVSPTVAYQINKTISVGFAPTLNYGLLEVAPFPAAPPDDANGDGFPSYADAPSTGNPGYGFQAGIQAAIESGFSFGASFKSTQKFSTYEFDAKDEVGAPRVLKFDLDYPMIISGGVGYSSGKLDLLADVKYIDYENTTGFEESGFDETGAIRGSVGIVSWFMLSVYSTRSPTSYPFVSATRLMKILSRMG